jgi:hypothetical protein
LIVGIIGYSAVCERGAIQARCAGGPHHRTRNAKLLKIYCPTTGIKQQKPRTAAQIVSKAAATVQLVNKEQKRDNAAKGTQAQRVGGNLGNRMDDVRSSLRLRRASATRD